MSPSKFFSEYELSDVLDWSKYARYHDVHVTDHGYVVTYLDPTVYTAWCIHNTATVTPTEYIEKLRSWNYGVCYFRHSTLNSEPLRTPVTMGLTSDLFPDTPFTHRMIL